MNVELLNREGVDVVTGSKMLPGEGNDQIAAPSAPAADVPLPPGLPPAYARDGESRRQTWERLRREARAVGMTRKASLAYATAQTDRFHPHFEPLPEPEPPPPEPEPVAEEPAVVVEPPAVQELPPSSSAGGVEGLGVLPEAWPTLPANATLSVEVAWVQANRLRVVQGGAVDLSRSLSPAPSYAALAWLETSILFPAKWADVTLRATQDAQDDQADVRREKVALAEVRSLMEEAASATL